MNLPRFPYGRRTRARFDAATPAVETRALTVRYPGADDDALASVTLSVPTGARAALTGPNGCGKSTLLKAVAGLLPPAAGEVRVFGGPVAAVRARVAYLPQRGEIDWRFPVTVRRLVEAGRFVHLGWLRAPGRHDRAATDAALERVGLVAEADRQIGQLSGGQQQRALLARALAQGADLFLLDEPFNHVDTDTRTDLTALIDDLTRAGVTTVVATHDLATLERDYDLVVRLDGGRLAAEAPHRSPVWTS
jgi:ABC-type Mn2+/Zn2+ transport system ATPase subunit